MTRLIIFILSLLLFIPSCRDANDDEENKVISTNEAPGAIGPYSQAIKTGNTIYVSGQIALDAGTGQLVDGGIKEQTHQVIKNVQKILFAAGYKLTDVVQCQVFLADLDHYEEMNNVYTQYFKDLPPARAVVEVKRIPRDALIELMVVASKQRE
jgi:2-iminobutanoate/2-iminopropanoate deaminase